MVGASRETVSRTLRELTLSGLLAVTGRRIGVANRAALEAAAQLEPVARFEPAPAQPAAAQFHRRSTDLAHTS
jgi:hypothetical protein